MNLEEKLIFLEDRIQRLNNISLALSKEEDINVIFELILDEALNITNADGRTLYMKNQDGNSMTFEILQTDSLSISMGGTSGKEIMFPDISLYDKNGKPNMKNNTTFVAHSGKTLNVKDAYKEKGYDFSGTISMDKKTGYHSKSILNVPLKNHENDTIGVIQLLNSINKDTGKIQSFSSDMQKLVESLASQGAVALTNKNLIKDLKELFESFIKLIAIAIDKKSPYTGGHCERVPEISMLLAEAVEKTTKGKYKNFSMNKDEKYELYIASWLHDCGKVATPTHIVDKATKLQTITDRIETIETRFEVLKRDLKISKLEKELQLIKNNSVDKKKIDEINLEFENGLKKILNEINFLKKMNIGSEFIKPIDKNRIVEIGKYKWKLNDKDVSLLDKNDIRNLQISKGTLLPEERLVINQHIDITIEMLEKLPYPNKLKNVPKYAGGHHEKLNGKGYPKGLTDKDLSVQAKIMAIADIFEALTAEDRPYKKGKTLSEALEIMRAMKNNNEIDKDLFEIFINKGVYKIYASKYLNKDKIDKIHKSKLLN